MRGVSTCLENSSSVASQLNSIQDIANTAAFAALKSDGSVVTWGHSVGGDSSSNRIGLVLNNRDIFYISAFAVKIRWFCCDMGV